MTSIYFILSAFLLSLSAQALNAKPQDFPSVLTAKERQNIAAEVTHPQKDFPLILKAIAEKLLGRPYKNGPLGEGQEAAIDPDPLYRLDTFDCTTFLETVLANAYCHWRVEKEISTCLAEQMKKIRYRDKKIDFSARNHIPELDWLPNNGRAGYLQEITQKIFPEAAKTIEFQFNRSEWLRTKGVNTLNSASAEMKTKKISYLPIAIFFKTLEDQKRIQELRTQQNIDLAAMKDPSQERERFRIEMEFLKQTQLPHEDNLRKIPSGTILNLLSGMVPNADATNITTLITHQGLILQGPDGPEIIHAAPNLGHVSKQKLVTYLLRYVKSNKARGISLYQINAPRTDKVKAKI